MSSKQQTFMPYNDGTGLYALSVIALVSYNLSQGWYCYGFPKTFTLTDVNGTDHIFTNNLPNEAGNSASAYDPNQSITTNIAKGATVPIATAPVIINTAPTVKQVITVDSNATVVNNGNNTATITRTTASGTETAVINTNNEVIRNENLSTNTVSVITNKDYTLYAIGAIVLFLFFKR